MLSTPKSTIASITCNNTLMVDISGSVLQTRKLRLTQNVNDLPKVTWLASTRAELGTRAGRFHGLSS